jgi:hypothetical protein
MNRTIVRSLVVLTAALALLALLALPGAASAAQPTQERVHFRLSDDPEVFDYDDCGATLPLTTFGTGNGQGYFVVETHGTPDPGDDTFVSLTGYFAGKSTITNTETGLSATVEEGYKYANAGGTAVAGQPDQIAFYATDTGTHKLRGPDGTVLWHSAGATTSLVVRIPSDGTLVSAEVLLRHGKVAEGDFCQALTAALGL